MRRNGVILFCGHAFKVRVARCVSPAPRELRWLSAKNNDDTIQIDGARVYYQQFADREAVLGTCEYSRALVELLTLWKGHLLVIDEPARADVIPVLDGDSNDVRFERALSLLHAGYGKTVLLDERTDQVQFGRTQVEAAQEFIARRHPANVAVCPGRMASTAEEAEVVAPCLLALQARRALIVTSAYHTRRALAIFRHRLPQYEWSVAAAPDETAYGTEWWRRRAWAKTWLGETERLAWLVVDRWRYGPLG